MTTGAFTPEISITRPQAVTELHFEMKEAGCEVLQAMAFYGRHEKLDTVDYTEKTHVITGGVTWDRVKPEGLM